MLGGVHIRGLARHTVQEAVELDKAGRVGVDDGEDALEVDLALLVLPDGVAEGDEAVLELLGVQSAGSVQKTDAVKVQAIVAFSLDDKQLQMSPN